MLLCYRIEQGKTQCYEDVFHYNVNKSESYFSKIAQYYSQITGQELNVSIYQNDNIPALSMSTKNKIFFQSKLVELKDVAMYLYFPHEIFHQLIGNCIKFEGKGKLWMLESLTEYMQWRYINSFNQAMARRMLDFYLNRYHRFLSYDISMLCGERNFDETRIKATVESRGVLIFVIFFNHIDDSKLKKFFLEMTSKECIKLGIFRELCEKSGIETSKMFSCLEHTKDYSYYEKQVNELDI